MPLIAESADATPHQHDPARVAAKGGRGRRRENTFLDDRVFPVGPDELDYMLHRQFDVEFEPSKHRSKLKSELKLGHLEAEVQSKLVSLI